MDRSTQNGEGRRKLGWKTWALIASFLLLALGLAGFNVEENLATERPDSVGFGVPWNHRLHADLPPPDYSCKSCHHRSEAGDTEMRTCDSDGCHLRGPARSPEQEGLHRLTVGFAVPASSEASPESTLASATKALGAVPGFRRIIESEVNLQPAKAEGEPGLIVAKLLVDVTQQGRATPGTAVTSSLEARVDNVEGVRITPVPSQRVALHKSCVNCHNAAAKGPTKCEDCHSRNSGNEACGSCHEQTLAQLREGPHKLNSCAGCHTRDVAHPAGTAHDGPVPKNGSRAICLSCHVEPDSEMPGFPRKALQPYQIPRVKATADQAHAPTDEALNVGRRGRPRPRRIKAPRIPPRGVRELPRPTKRGHGSPPPRPVENR